MKNPTGLLFTSQGIKGGDFTNWKNVGCVIVKPNEAYNLKISFDAFEGQGVSYQRRDETHIKIETNETIFSGSLKEFEKTFENPILIAEVLNGVVHKPILFNSYDRALDYFNNLLIDEVGDVEETMWNGGFDNENGTEILVKWLNWG